MNINQNYGMVQMPSQIMDSFYDSENNMSKVDHQYQSELIHDDDDDSYVGQQLKCNRNNKFGIQAGKTYHKNMKNRVINLDQSLQDDDVFLDNVDLLLANNADPHKNKLKPSPTVPHSHTNNTNSASGQNKYIQCSVSEITKVLLPSQTIKESIQIINTCAQIIIVRIKSTPFTFSCRGQDNISQLYLQAYSKLQLEYTVQKKTEQIGDIYDTIIIQSCLSSLKSNGRPIKIYIPVQIKYVTPSINLKYKGCSEALANNNISPSSQKISMNRICKNKHGQYQIELRVNSGIAGQKIDRFQCGLSTRGQISAFPNQLIFYDDQPRTLYIRSKSKNHGMGVLIIRGTNAKVNYVLGIQLL